MSEPTRGTSRRDALRLGGAAVGGLVAAGPLLAVTASADAATGDSGSAAAAARLPVAEIEAIIRAKGTFANGVLNIEIDRDDIPNVKKEGVPIKPAFEINGNLCFQALPDGSVMFNGDLAFKAEELNPAIDQIISHGLQFQAEHQHLFGLNPMVWFMHMRGRGTARALAKGCAAILSVTSTPLPQAPPKHPTTPLDPGRLAKIIGAPATVGASGVVSFQIPRRNPITLGGVRISPFLNVYIPIDFQPLGAQQAVVVPDFGQVAAEIDRLDRTMRGLGWEINCLYNQETDEQPQLYFSHDFKVGNAYQLAAEVRRGLEQLDVVLH
jgi:Domain of Unknown Function (DUF1259)